MDERLEVIQQIIEFHHTIRNELQQAGQSVSDLEALFKLRGEYAGLSQSSMADVAGRIGKIGEILKSLEAGLSGHFAYEETNLPPVLGEVLTQGLLVEHAAIRREIEAMDTLLKSTAYDTGAPDAAILQKTKLQQAMVNLSQSIEKHASREEVVLDMARRGLEA